MRLSFDESELLIQRSAREFAAKDLAPRAHDIDKNAHIPREILRSLSQLGLMGVNVPEIYGGSEAGARAYSLAMIEISGACASTAVTMAVSNMVAEVICLYGTEEQKKRYASGICRGEWPAASFALSEADAGSDPGAMRTTARLDGDTWIISGSKQWITSGDFAGVFVVWARTDDDSRPGTRGISAFLVERATQGLSVGRHEDKMGLRGSSTTTLVFDECRIPASALLGQLHGGFRIAMSALDGGRIGIASQAIGIARAALRSACAYAKERKTFGKPIADHQGLQWMIADSDTELCASEMLVFRAAALKDAGKPFGKEAAMAKLYASEAANRVCDRALQIHGGYGYTKEYSVERNYRDVRVTRIYEGTSEIQRIVIGRAQLS